MHEEDLKTLQANGDTAMLQSRASKMTAETLQGSGGYTGRFFRSAGGGGVQGTTSFVVPGASQTPAPAPDAPAPIPEDNPNTFTDPVTPQDATAHDAREQHDHRDQSGPPKPPIISPPTFTLGGF